VPRAHISVVLTVEGIAGNSAACALPPEKVVPASEAMKLYTGKYGW